MIYYIKIFDKQYKCNICESIVTSDDKSKELMDHIIKSHKEVYDLHKDNPESNVGFQIEYLQFSMLKDDKSQPVILEEVCETTADVIEKIDDKDHKESVDMQYVLVPRKKKLRKKFSRKRSWVWKYFESLTSIIYRCNLCNVVLSIKGFNSNNMNRHVRSRHPSVYKAEVMKKDMSELEQEISWKNEEESDKDLDETSNKIKQRRSWVWSYFKRLSSTLAQCKLCSRNICHGGNSTGNMNRHLKMIHNKIGEFGHKRSWVWKYFESVTSSIYRCNLCTGMISKKGRQTNNMNRHFRLRHPSEYKREVKKKDRNKLEKEYEHEEKNKDMSEQEVSGENKEENDKDMDETRNKMKKRSSWVWFYFKRLSNNLAQCKLCRKNIHSCNSTGNLSRHLKIVHKKIGEITKKDINEMEKWENEEENQDMSELEQEFSGKNKEENDKDMDETSNKMKKRSSWVWFYFKRLSSNLAQCKLCRKNLHSCNSTGNLSRHLKIKHKKFSEVTKKDMNELEKEWKNEEENKDVSELEQEVSGENKEENDKDMDETSNKMKERSSWVWSYFKRLSSNIAQCKLCRKNIHSCNSTGNLSRHLKIVHNKTNDKIKKRSSWVWTYFKRLSSNIAQCKLCRKNIHSCNSTGNLSRHLKIVHKKIGEDHDWVWQVFETDDDDFFSCKICENKIMKFDDVNKSVTCILEHLKDEHAVVSGDQIIVETELDIGSADLNVL